MPRQRQLYLSGMDGLGTREFGGSLLRGHAREQRPISLKRPMHLVLRSSHARGEKSFLNRKRARRIELLIHRLGKEHQVKVYRFANGGNHLHLLVLPRSREALSAYLRAISGIIARIALGVERGRARGVKFWDSRPYTRIVEWGREFKTVCDYVLQNILEAIGFIPYQPRRMRGKRVHKGRGSAGFG